MSAGFSSIAEAPTGATSTGAWWRPRTFWVTRSIRSIFPGSNRLIFTGFSPAWGGFYISSMGGAGLEFDNLGINMLSVVGRAPTPSAGRGRRGAFAAGCNAGPRGKPVAGQFISEAGSRPVQDNALPFGSRQARSGCAWATFVTS